MTDHRHTYRHANLAAPVIPCDTCGVPADQAQARKLRRQLRRLKAANAVLRRLGGSR